MSKQKRSVNYALRIDTEIVDDNLDIKSRQSLFFSAFSHFYRYALFIYMCVLYSIHTHTQHQACCGFTMLAICYATFFSLFHRDLLIMVVILVYFYFLSFVHFCLQINFFVQKA